ncbi:MAG: sirohydrochlorin chelatase [Rubripirellula sp.]
MTQPASTSAGVLLIGHGTRDAVGTEQFFELERRLAQRLGSTPVAAALLEFQRPSIPEGWNSLLSEGVQHVHVAPLLLFAAGHAKQDIPEVIRACVTATPSITHDQSRPVSRHPSIVELVVQRISNALGQISVAPERTSVVMVGRGSHDPCAQADMRVLTEVVKQRLPVATVETAFYAMAEPKLPAVLNAVASSGRYDAVVVYPHLLFEGRLNQAIIRQTEEASALFPALTWRTAEYLGPNEQVADAIATRIEQAAARPLHR